MKLILQKMQLLIQKFQKNLESWENREKDGREV